MNFNKDTDYATWKDKDERLNLFDNEVAQTELININTHLKIDSNNFLPGSSKNPIIVSFNGPVIYQGSWPNDNSFSYRSNVLNTVKKVNDNFVPMVSLIKYQRNYNRYKKVTKIETFLYEL